MREVEEEAGSSSEIVNQLSERQRLRMEVIQDLIASPDQEMYRQRQQAAAERLNLSISSIQRLVRAWKVLRLVLFDLDPALNDRDCKS